MSDSQRRLWRVVRRALLMICAAIEHELATETEAAVASGETPRLIYCETKT